MFRHFILMLIFWISALFSLFGHLLSSSVAKEVPKPNNLNPPTTVKTEIRKLIKIKLRKCFRKNPVLYSVYFESYRRLYFDKAEFEVILKRVKNSTRRKLKRTFGVAPVSKQILYRVPVDSIFENCALTCLQHFLFYLDHAGLFSVSAELPTFSPPTVLNCFIKRLVEGSDPVGQEHFEYEGMRKGLGVVDIAYFLRSFKLPVCVSSMRTDDLSKFINLLYRKPPGMKKQLPILVQFPSHCMIGYSYLGKSYLHDPGTHFPSQMGKINVQQQGKVCQVLYFDVTKELKDLPDLPVYRLRGFGRNPLEHIQPSVSCDYIESVSIDEVLDQIQANTNSTIDEVNTYDQSVLNEVMRNETALQADLHAACGPDLGRPKRSRKLSRVMQEHLLTEQMLSEQMYNSTRAADAQRRWRQRTKKRTRRERSRQQRSEEYKMALRDVEKRLRELQPEKETFISTEDILEKVPSMTENCCAELQIQRSICLVCQQRFERKTSEGIVKFDESSILWKNVTQFCRPLRSISGTLTELYDVSHITGIESLRGTVLSPLGVLRCHLDRPYDDQSLQDQGSFVSDNQFDEGAGISDTEDVQYTRILEANPDEAWENHLFSYNENSLFNAFESGQGTEFRFAFCSECKAHLSKPSCDRFPLMAIANDRLYGCLPAELAQKVNIPLKFAVSRCMPFITLKTYHRGPSTTEKLVGTVSIVDLGMGIASVLTPLAFKHDTSRVRILVQTGLGDDAMKYIRDLNCLVVNDMVQVFKFLRNNDSATFGDFAYSDGEMRAATFGNDLIDVIEVVNDFPEPPERTTAIGLTHAFEDSRVSLTYKFFSRASSGDSAELDYIAQQVLGSDAPRVTTDNRVHTASLYPGKQYTSIEKPRVLQRLFPLLFPFGNGPVNPGRTGRTSFLREIRHLLNDGTGVFANDLHFVATVYSYLKQKQISEALTFRVKNLTESQLRTALTISSDELLQALQKMEHGIRLTNHPRLKALLNPVAQAIGSSHGSDGERYAMRNKIFATSDTFGLWTWFLTISPSIENNNYLNRYLIPESDRFEGSVNLIIDMDTVINLNGHNNIPTKEECLRAAQGDVQGCVEFFVRMRSTFFEQFLGWDEKQRTAINGGGMLGTVQSLASSVETNGRGVLHGHTLVKVKEAPSGRVQFNNTRSHDPNEFDERLFKYASAVASYNYDISMEEAVCPYCLQAGTFTSFTPVTPGYAAAESRYLPPPTTVKCNCCSHDCLSGDVVRATCMKELFPHEACTGGGDITVRWSKEEVHDCVRFMIFGESIEGRKATFNDPTPLGRAWHCLLQNYFQEHLSTHTSTCFKSRDKKFCRMRFPRDINAQSRVVDGNVELQRSPFSEWLNGSLRFGMDVFQCNQDATFLCSGSREGTSVAIYCTKYTGKPQGQLDAPWIQLIVVHFLKRVHREETRGIQSRLRDQQNGLDSDQIRSASHGRMRSLAWSITQSEEIDPQLMLYHVLHGKPFVSSHDFAHLNVQSYINRAFQLPQTVLLQRQNKVWEAKHDYSLDYLARPSVDNRLPLYLYTMTRVILDGVPKIPQETLRSTHPKAGKCLVKPMFRVVVPFPRRPSVSHLPSRAICVNHLDCLPKKKAGSCQCVGTIVHNPPAYYTSFVDGSQERVETADLDDSFGLDNVETDEYEIDGIGNLDNLLGVDFGFDHVESFAPSDDAIREKWGVWMAVCFSHFRDISKLKICRNESWWDAGNRVLQNLFDLARTKNLVAETLCTIHFNMNELQRTAEDVAARHKQAADWEQRVQADLDARRIDGKTNSEKVAGEDQVQLDHLKEEALNLLDREEAFLFLKARDERFNSVSPDLKCVHEELLPTVKRIVESSHVRIKDVESVYEEEKHRQTNHILSVAGEEVSKPQLSFGNWKSLLQSVSDSFSLQNEQYIAFMVIGVRLLQDILPGEPVGDLPFTLPPGYLHEQLRLIVTGQGGTGKSQIINALRTLAEACNQPACLRTAAYIGVAAVNAHGSTIHSAAALGISTTIKQKVSDSLKTAWKNVKLLIIDEYGTCGKTTFARLDQTLRLCKENDMPFGNINVVLMGDHFQFDPPGDLSLHAETNPNARHSALYHKADLTFQLFDRVIHLFKNFRAVGDPIYTTFLENLRNPNYFLNDAAMERDACMLNERHVAIAQGNTNSPPVFLVPTNREKRSLIKASQQVLIDELDSDPDVCIYQWNNTNMLPHEPGKFIHYWDILGEYFWETGSKMKAPPFFWAYKGMPVTVTTNPSPLQQSFGVATGANGRIRDIVFSETCRFEKNGVIVQASEIPNYIIVEFDTPADHTFLNFEPRCRPIGPIQTEGTTRFSERQHPRKGNEALNLKFKYQAFPLRHRFAQTLHSAQCLTMDNILIGDPALTAVDYTKMLYLGLSRAKSLSCVRTTVRFDAATIKKYAPHSRDIHIENSLLERHNALITEFQVDPCFLTETQQRRTTNVKEWIPGTHETTVARAGHSIPSRRIKHDRKDSVKRIRSYVESIPSHKTSNQFLLLPNFSNCCYLNSVVQTFRTFPSTFSDLLVSNGPFSSTLKDLLTPEGAYQVTTCSPLLEQMLCYPNSRFRRGLQEDAGEALQFLLERLSIENRDSSLWTISIQEKLVCLQCNASKIKIEQQCQLHIELPEQPSFQSLLNSYGSVETVDLTCSGCGGQKAFKTSLVQSPPPILLLQLKRWKYAEGGYEKLHSFINLPYLNPVYFSGFMYEMRAVIHHIGPDHAQGHYYADVKEEGLWYRLDDANPVTAVNCELFANGTTCYILVFRRLS